LTRKTPFRILYQRKKQVFINKFNHFILGRTRIVSELAAVFNDSANTLGYLNPDIGGRHRREILEPGASRDVNESVTAFTGHELDPARRAFLVSLGVTPP